MTGLRLVGWSAGASVGAGALALLLFALLPPTGQSDDATASASGATFATVEERPAPALVVTSLRTGGAEARAGLHVGDTIETLNGVPHPSLRAVRQELEHGGVVHVVRHGGAVALTVGSGRQAPPLRPAVRTD